MLIICPSCAASYEVETACFGEAGRLVRCVRCGDVWLGTQSLLVAAIMAENEQAEIDACTPDGEAQCEALSAPQSSSDMQALPDEADAFEPNAATTALHGDTLDDPTHITPGSSESVPRQRPASPASFLLGPAPERWDAPALPGEIEVVVPPAVPQAYVLRKGRRACMRGSPGRVTYLLIAALALVALNTAFVGWRRQVVKIAPQTASLYQAIGLPVNLRGLSIANITTLAQMHDGVPLLLVEGTLASTSTRTVKVPRLRLALRNGAGQELYSWTQEPERRTLRAGESLTFRTRLASPPPEAHDVVVRFFNRDDTAGMQQTAAIGTSRRGEPQ